MYSIIAKRVNDLSLRALGTMVNLKNDERGLSGVVVAVMLTLMAVLIIGVFWDALEGWLNDMITVITTDTTPS